MAWMLLVIFLLLTLLFLTGRGSPLLIGFNSLPKEEQAQYRIKSICHDFGAFVLLPLDAVWLLCYFFLKQDIWIALMVLAYVIYLVVCAVLFEKRGGLKFYRRDVSRRVRPKRTSQR